MRLQTKILAGYLVLVAVICSMAAILVHERGRMREIEAETGEIQEIRRDITVAQRSITTLATLGEGIIGWEEADYRHYRIRRECSDITVLEYIVSGTGHLCVENRSYTVCAGDVYLLHPFTSHDYHADWKDPWEKIWFNLSGPLVEHLIDA